MDDTSVRKQLTKFFNQAIRVPKYVSYFFIISYLFTCVTEYSCIDFKYYNTLFWLSFHCFHSDHIINLLKRSTKFLYDAKYSTNIMALTHTRMIIEIRIGASISSLVERMDSWLSLECSVSFWIKDESNLWKVVFPTLPTEIKGLVLSAVTFVRRKLFSTK